ncbi:MAG: TM2 domain-containing protein [Woeseia sp.]|jgi:hypothetical protein|nr:TM2 domain-containing protein [Woeseia sp.]
MSDNVEQETLSANIAEKKSVKTMYLLWFTVGFFGAHRWYVGRWAWQAQDFWSSQTVRTFDC